MLRSVAALAAAVLVALSLAGRARASVDTETTYTKSQTYNAALRYLRVDLGYEVIEKDANAAYLLFRFGTGGKKTTGGAIEIVDQQSGERVRVSVRLPELPHYHEQMLSDGLFQKLRNEYGDPPRHDEAPAKDKDDKGRKGDDKGDDKNKSSEPDGGS